MTAAATSAARPGRASRRQPVDRLHRATQAVLVGGSVLALAAAAGPLWLVRVGLVVAVLTTVVSVALAWRELTAARRQHAQRLLVVDKRHGETLRAERTRNAAVVDALNERVSSAGMVVAGQRSVIAQLRGEVGVLTTERDGLAEQVAERDGLLGLFRASLREQEAALVEARESERTGADVHHLPRRSRPADAVEDVTAPEPVLDPQMVELAMVLPNYEGSRRAV